MLYQFQDDCIRKSYLAPSDMIILLIMVVWQWEQKHFPHFGTFLDGQISPVGHGTLNWESCWEERRREANFFFFGSQTVGRRFFCPKVDNQPPVAKVALSSDKFMANKQVKDGQWNSFKRCSIIAFITKLGKTGLVRQVRQVDMLSQVEILDPTSVKT